MRSKPRLSQVFLKDERYIQKIIEAIRLNKEDVVEIGPGKGQVTKYLYKIANFLYCVELDIELYNLLSAKFKSIKNIKIIHNDILKFSFSNLGKKVVVFGNIPYQISSPLINYLIKNRNFISSAYLTLQEEFAEKLLARPSTPQYNFLSCYVQYYFELKKIFRIPSFAFKPRPKVNSLFIEFNFHKKNHFKAIDEKLLFNIIRQAFSQRRKKIINSLIIPQDKKNFFISLGIPENLRAEDISLEEYISIANKLYSLQH
ncbi:MAG: ribosomal RNA small subunit methyltransferase A [Candidatus Omnitrophica bacterium]|jgi:16S rRNA (adenine1518-N6/adenine1519-N6)-dimethyltransferase|nr:ribosomal RNA small subunit methyltransferase A [Candidatus Omnitrophota bacterium]